MSLRLGSRLKIRSMIHVAAEPLPLFWPMRTFIHHNPLHGLEYLPFHAAVLRGAELFRARAFLPRAEYQRLLAENAIDRDRLKQAVTEFVATRAPLPGIDLQVWLIKLLTEVPDVRRAAAHAGRQYCRTCGPARPVGRPDRHRHRSPLRLPEGQATG